MSTESPSLEPKSRSPSPSEPMEAMHISEPQSEHDEDSVPTENGDVQMQNFEPGQTSPKPDLTTPEAQEEKLRRKDLHGPTYFAFLAEANKRNLQRHDLATRNKIWDQDMAKARKRIEDMEMERAQLVKNIEGMEKAKGAYNEEMIVEMSRDEDMEVKETWERFFNLGSDQLPTWD